MPGKKRMLYRCPRCGEEYGGPANGAGWRTSCISCYANFNIPWTPDAGITPAVGSGEQSLSPQSAAAVSFSCPRCGETIGHDPDLAGLQVFCPHCLTQFEMPAGEYAQPGALFGLPGPTLSLQGARRRIREGEGRFYVYALCLPSGEPFYVGKGFEDRIAAHEAESLNPRSDDAKHRTIRTIKSRGLRVGYRLLGFFDSENEALAQEKSLIARFGRLDQGTGRLANLSDGGEGLVEKYFSERWEVDDNGVRVLRAVAKASPKDLAPPRFRSAEDAITATDSEGKAWVQRYKKREEWTGPKMPLIAQWEGHGLTVQVFSEEKNVGAWLRCFWRNKKRDLLPVLFRVFDGDRKILEDRSAFSPFGRFGPALSSRRPSCPSRERLSAERQLVISILGRLADMAGELEGRRVCFDWHYGRKSLTKRQQAWVKHNAESLKKIADSLAESEP